MKYEHRDDKLNRILTDRVADQVKAACKAGYKFPEIIDALRRGLWLGNVEAVIAKGGVTDETKVERRAYADACAAIPEEAR